MSTAGIAGLAGKAKVHAKRESPPQKPALRPAMLEPATKQIAEGESLVNQRSEGLVIVQLGLTDRGNLIRTNSQTSNGHRS